MDLWAWPLHWALHLCIRLHTYWTSHTHWAVPQIFHIYFTPNSFFFYSLIHKENHYPSSSHSHKHGGQHFLHSHIHPFYLCNIRTCFFLFHPITTTVVLDIISHLHYWNSPQTGHEPSLFFMILHIFVTVLSTTTTIPLLLPSAIKYLLLSSPRPDVCMHIPTLFW